MVIGHNARIAWAMTSRDADVQDVYVERVNPANPHQVDDGGRWADTVIIADPIVSRAGQKPLAFEREYTRHGAVIASDRERHLAYTIRWTGFEPGTAGELAALGLDRAQSDSELRAALGRWKLPAATFIYASADGQVGSHAAGWTPVRPSWSGALPVPGWSGEDEWKGMAPIGTRIGAPGPGRRSATAAHVASANGNLRQNAPYRTALERAGDVRRSTTSRACSMTPWRGTPSGWFHCLRRCAPSRADVEEARRRLLRWDRRLTVESDAATVYALWEPRLLRALARLAVPSALVDDFAARARHLLVPALTSAVARVVRPHRRRRAG